MIFLPESCPTVSPLPSDFTQPEEVESEVSSQVSRSEGVMFTRVLNSWITVSLSLTIFASWGVGRGSLIVGFESVVDGFM